MKLRRIMRESRCFNEMNGALLSSSAGSCLKIHTSDHEWPRVDHEWQRGTTSDHEWPRVTTSDYEWPRVRMHQNILLMSWWRHHHVTLSNNHYFTANWPFLETLIPGFDISAISDWMGEGLGDGQGGGTGVQTSRHPHPLISVPATFLIFSSRPFFRLPWPPSLFSTRSPKFCPPPSLSPTPPEGYQWPRAKKKGRKWKWQKIKINKGFVWKYVI